VLAIADEVIEWCGSCPLMAQSRHDGLHCTRLLSGVKRTWPFAACLLLRSLLRVKRTSLFAPHMSAS